MKHFVRISLREGDSKRKKERERERERASRASELERAFTIRLPKRCQLLIKM